MKIPVFTRIATDESGSNQHKTRISKLSYIRKFLDHYFLNFCFTRGPSKSSVLLRTSVPDPEPDPDPHVLGLPDPDPLVRGMDPDPDPAPDVSIIMQK